MRREPGHTRGSFVCLCIRSVLTTENLHPLDCGCCSELRIDSNDRGLEKFFFEMPEDNGTADLVAVFNMEQFADGIYATVWKRLRLLTTGRRHDPWMAAANLFKMTTSTAAIKRSRGFSPAKFLETAAKGRGISTHPSGEILYTQGDDADSVFYIKRGKVKITVLFHALQGSRYRTPQSGRILRRGMPNRTAAALVDSGYHD